jgi:nicotinamidase-related amidase
VLEALMPLIDADDTIFLVIDTQPGFVRKVEPTIGDETVDRIHWLVRVATGLGIPLVVTEEEAERNGRTVDRIDALIPPNVARHTKPAFGVAACPPIMADLERHHRGTAVLTGFETDVCVSQSAIGLADSGWRVVVVEDAVASPGSAHAQGLARMRDAGIELIGVKGLSYEWLRTVEATAAIDAVLAQPPLGITL